MQTYNKHRNFRIENEILKNGSLKTYSSEDGICLSKTNIKPTLYYKAIHTSIKNLNTVQNDYQNPVSYGVYYTLQKVLDKYEETLNIIANQINYINDLKEDEQCSIDQVVVKLYDNPKIYASISKLNKDTLKLIIEKNIFQRLLRKKSNL